MPTVKLLCLMPPNVRIDDGSMNSLKRLCTIDSWKPRPGLSIDGGRLQAILFDDDTTNDRWNYV